MKFEEEMIENIRIFERKRIEEEMIGNLHI